MTNPDAILSRVVDFGDGTYGVNLADNYYRVDNRLVVARPGNPDLNYVSLGSNGSICADHGKGIRPLPRRRQQLQLDRGWFCFDVFNTVFEAQDAEQIWFNMGAGPPVAGTDLLGDPADDGRGYAPTLGIQFTTDPSVPLVTLHQYVVLDYALDGFGWSRRSRCTTPGESTACRPSPATRTTGS